MENCPTIDEDSEDSSSQVSKIQSVETSERRSVSSARYEMASQAMNLATIYQCRAKKVSQISDSKMFKAIKEALLKRLSLRKL